ncbi:MAG TPA: histidine kinase dimerization/phospho-acceptor domain-containing protein, partial [Alphaproteobacteria bacterium]|nr:histidine kinase dimerization/phospho-acceptor domain-containing protein [Alphaproteobacteria bacterium]
MSDALLSRPVTAPPEPRAAAPSETGRREWDAAVAAERIRLVYRNSATPLGANVVVGLMTGWVLWDVAPHGLVLGWTGLVVGVALLRTALVLRYRRRRPPPEALPAWGRAFTVGAFGSGLLWGLAALLFLPTGQIAQETFVVFTLLGMAAGSMASHAAYLPAFYAYAGPTALGLAAAMALQALEGSGVHGSLALLSLVFFTVLVMGARGFEHSLSGTLRLRFANADLIAELRTARRTAEQANRAKSDFLAQMSHELRTPLTAVIGFAEILEEQLYGPHSDPRYRDYAADIRASGSHLLDLINDVLDLSKAEAGKYTLREDTIELRRLVDSAVRLVRQRVEAAGLTLSVALVEPGPVLRVDPRAMKQVLLNLLINAVKFTPAGGSLTLTAALRPEGLELRLRDTGIGMRPQDIPKALMPFQQVENVMVTDQRGTGLGL